jgi:hypothetical protein
MTGNNILISPLLVLINFSILPLISCLNCPSSTQECCHYQGSCNTENTCICYDQEHFWSSEYCSTYHIGPELKSGEFCTPNVRNAYCSYLGVCSTDGKSCMCDVLLIPWRTARLLELVIPL